VTNGGTAVSLLSFNVVPSGVGVTTAPPSVVNPPTGAIGTLVSITGHGLLGITHITMVATGGGVLTISPILPSTGTLITFDIPANADTAATNTITLDYGIGSLQIPFTVTPA